MQILLQYNKKVYIYIATSYIPQKLLVYLPQVVNETSCKLNETETECGRGRRKKKRIV